MKITAFLASVFVAAAVQASDVTLHYCFDADECYDALVEPNTCTDLERAGYLTSVSNTGWCSLFDFPGCGGRSIVAPPGTNIIKREHVGAVACSEPRLSQNLAPTVQTSEALVYYCLRDGRCTYASMTPNRCTPLELAGRFALIQSNANCALFKRPGCEGEAFHVRRGQTELSGNFAEAIACGEPYFHQSQRPMRRH